jgi:integrase/recombinase XerD
MTIQKRRTNRLTPTLKPMFSFEQLVEEFLHECRRKNFAETTIKFHRTNLLQFPKGFSSQSVKLDIQSLTLQNLKQYFLDPMLQKKLATNTINGRIKSCKSFFAFLLQEGYIRHHAAQGLVCLKKEQRMIHTFSKEQILQLLQMPNQETFTGLRNYTMMLVLLETGLRASELLDLKLADVLFKDKEIRVHKGKGRKARIVPFQRTCGRAIQHYIDMRGDLPTDILFISIDNKPLQLRSFQEILHDYGEMAEIEGVRVSPHTFRHSMSKFYILNGGDPFSLQRILGHSSLEMVHTYVQLFSGEVKKQHEKFSPVQSLMTRENKL